MPTPNEVFFEKVVLQYLGLEYDVSKRDNGSYTLVHEKFGTIDIYPKKQRLLFRDNNKWYNNAFDLINNMLLTEKFK
ncbi:hypothetical protein CMU02_09065 [Elizabethkingia anophelis]|nr:hypothetical protein [Elizabethkingia anophelis]MDV3904960.1 hypothetical protein [Elizabethkingia anophelis]